MTTSQDKFFLVIVYSVEEWGWNSSIVTRSQLLLPELLPRLATVSYIKFTVCHTICHSSISTNLFFLNFSYSPWIQFFWAALFSWRLNFAVNLAVNYAHSVIFSTMNLPCGKVSNDEYECSLGDCLIVNLPHSDLTTFDFPWWIHRRLITFFSLWGDERARWYWIFHKIFDLVLIWAPNLTYHPSKRRNWCWLSKWNIGSNWSFCLINFEHSTRFSILFQFGPWSQFDHSRIVVSDLIERSNQKNEMAFSDEAAEFEYLIAFSIQPHLGSQSPNFTMQVITVRSYFKVWSQILAHHWKINVT